MTKGARNLALLGVAAVAVAAITTGVSLMIYHNSGDIYLDRSRPGFLPDEDEIEEDNGKGEGGYEFPKNGKLSIKDVNEYLEKIEMDVEAIDSYKDPFSEETLSNKNLGIPEDEN